MFRVVVESSPNALVLVDPQGKIVLVNQQAEQLFGYDRTELIGQAIEVLVPQPYREKHPVDLAKFFKDPHKRAMGAGRDLYGLRKDGSRVPVEIGLTPVTTPNGTFVLSAIVDITHRKRAEERFRIAVEASPNAVIMVNGHGQMVLVNRQTELMFGYGRAELLGQPVEVLVPSRFREGHPAYRRHFFADPKARPMGAGRDLFGLRKDGTEFPVEIGLNPIMTDEGLMVLSAVVDITSRKKAEHVLARQAQELARSNAELQQFAYVASHDLREPLRAVAGCLQILGERAQAKLDSGDHELMNHAVEGAYRMQQLIDDLLAYSRVGTQAGTLRPVNMNQVMKAVLANLASLIAESKAVVEHPPLPEIHADHTQMIQLLQNLVGNAVKYRSDRPPRVQVSAHRQNDDWVFRVSDNGIGIEPQYFERIFGVFQRLHTRTRYPGTGIGLAICKKIVEHHGGRIWVESTLGQGSSFLFSIPAKGEDQF
jgi:PAS domain S-box-containing protein